MHPAMAEASGISGLFPSPEATISGGQRRQHVGAGSATGHRQVKVKPMASL